MLTYSFPNLAPVCCFMSSCNCCFLTCIQISQDTGQVVWYSHLFQNFPQFVVIHTVKGFGIANKAEVDVFLELAHFFDDSTDVGIWSLVPLSFLNPIWTSESSQFTYCRSLAWRILSITLLACDSPSPAFHIMYSAYKLNKQTDNIQSWRTSFPIWNQSIVPYPVLTVASWPAYRFVKMHVRWSGIHISFRIFHSLLWSKQSKALA